MGLEREYRAGRFPTAAGYMKLRNFLLAIANLDFFFAPNLRAVRGITPAVAYVPTYNRARLAGNHIQTSLA